jgi:uroporphyrinogen decarboxylase
LGVEDYCRYVLPSTTELVQKVQSTGVPVIYFGTGTQSLLALTKQTGADVIGVDWRMPLDQAWQKLGSGAIQGNLDPVLLFAEWNELKSRAREILDRVNRRSGHIFNLGHGILPETPVESVKALTKFVQEYSCRG